MKRSQVQTLSRPPARTAGQVESEGPTCWFSCLAVGWRAANAQQPRTIPRNWRGRLAFGYDGTLWHGSYPLTATLASIGLEAAAIISALTVPSLTIEPLLVMHGKQHLWREQYLGGIADLPARRLVASLLSLPPVLTDQQVAQLANCVIGASVRRFDRPEAYGYLRTGQDRALDESGAGCWNGACESKSA